MAIETIEGLRAHLALATRIELSTIPPYLYAMYTIQDQESEAARLIASVVVEEMLHVCLVTNLLLALGGEPDFCDGSAPTYPSPLAHHQPELILGLAPCSTDLIRNTFMVIERPHAPDGPPEDDDYKTLGQFYAALELAIDDLGAGTALFAHHQPERQLADPAFYGAVEFDADDSGGLVLVHDRESAREALEIIIHQGEGVSDERWADPEHRELTHFFKFEQLAEGGIPIGPVWPAMENPRTDGFPPRVQVVSNLFNALYGLVYLTMDGLFAGTHDQNGLIRRLYSLMSKCLAPTARYLVSLPVDADHTAGPTFEAYQFGSDPWGETARLAADLVAEHPALEPVAKRVAAFTPF